MSWVSNVEYGGFFLAEKNGYYADENLTVDMVPWAAEAPTAAAQVAADTAQVGVTAGGVSAFQAISDGNDFKVLGSIFQENVGCLLGHDQVKSVADLQGKKILAQSEATVNELFDLAGVPLGDTQIISTGFGPDAWVAGDGDYYTAYLTNQPGILETSFGMTEGKDFYCTPLQDLGMLDFASTIFAKSSYVEQNRDVLVRFLRATLKGWQDYMDNPDAAAQLTVDEYGADLGLDLAQQQKEAEAFVKLMKSDATDKGGLFSIDVDKVQNDIYPVYEVEGVTGLPPASDVIDLSLLADAQK